MPTTEKRARKLIETSKATPFWKKGIFCIRLNFEPSSRNKQQIVVGIDPGSKREAYTIRSKKHTLLNIQTETPVWVKKKVETRRNARKARRFRKTPCRKPRFNNKSKPKLPPSTKSRWQLKLRILDFLSKAYPITDVVFEDIKATTKKGKKSWNLNFSPLQVGKKWFCEQVKQNYKLTIKEGWETAVARKELGLEKIKEKLSDRFEAHCVDSFTLSSFLFLDKKQPENKSILYLKPIQFHRRQLHVFNFSKGGKRKLYGGTMSLRFKRGSIVKHPKYNICYVGGSSKGRISLHNLETGKRLCQNSKIEDLKFLSYNSFQIRRKPFLPQDEPVGILA